MQEHPPARLADRAHGLTALDLAHVDRHVVVDDREVRGLAALFHQPAEIRARAAPDVARLEKGIADDKGLHADGPSRAVRLELHEAVLLQRCQQAVSGRRRKLGGPDDFGERRAVILRRHGFDDRERPRQRLNAGRPFRRRLCSPLPQLLPKRVRRILSASGRSAYMRGGSSGNDLLPAVSKTSDPTQGWQALRLAADPSGQDSLDFARLGLNQDGVFPATDAERRTHRADLVRRRRGFRDGSKWTRAGQGVFNVLANSNATRSGTVEFHPLASPALPQGP